MHKISIKTVSLNSPSSFPFNHTLYMIGIKANKYSSPFYDPSEAEQPAYKKGKGKHFWV